MIYLDEKSEVLKLLSYICDSAVRLKVMVHGDEMYRYIYRSIKNNQDCFVEQIVELSNQNCNDDTSDMEHFENIYEMLWCGQSYRVYYEYSDYSKIVTYSYIISDKGILVFHTYQDSGAVVGMYTDRRDIISYYERCFEDLKSKSYVYGWSSRKKPREGRYLKRTFENADSSVRVGIYQADNQTEVWIRKKDVCHHEKYISIVEDTVVNLFCKYINAFG